MHSANRCVRELVWRRNGEVGTSLDQPQVRILYFVANAVTSGNVTDGAAGVNPTAGGNPLRK